MSAYIIRKKTEAPVVKSSLRNLFMLAETWETICGERLATKDPWDFSKRAPHGTTGKLVQIDTRS